ncbi:MAG: hypothetical protein L0Y68_10015 [Candidatus Dadabacteria bacterium]|nr:hypothetical protein [Candidatus Dadabacteria bacterium]
MVLMVNSSGTSCNIALDISPPPIEDLPCDSGTLLGGTINGDTCDFAGELFNITTPGFPCAFAPDLDVISGQATVDGQSINLTNFVVEDPTESPPQQIAFPDFAADCESVD